MAYRICFALISLFLCIYGQQANLTFSTYLGGSGEDMVVNMATYASNIYLVGRTRSLNFPVVAPIQATLNANSTQDAFISVISSSTNQLVFSTYFGGSGDDVFNDVFVGSDYLIVVGKSASADYRITSNQTFGGVSDGVITYVSMPSGNIAWSNFLGGSGDDEISAVTVNSTGFVFVTGSTSSSNFPVTTGTTSSLRSAFFAVYNSTGTLIYCRVMTASGTSSGMDVSVSSSGTVVVVGQTDAVDFPSVASTATYGGSTDGFVAVFDAAGTIIKSSYFGGTGTDILTSVSFGSGYYYVGGYSVSSNFPVTTGSLNGAAFDGVLLGISESGVVSFSKFFGGSSIDKIYSVTATVNNTVFVSGTTVSTDFPVSVSSAYSTTIKSSASYDTFVSVFDFSGSGVFSTYLGGSNNDEANAVGTLGATSIVVAGWTLSSDFPVNTTIQTTIGGSYDGFVSQIGGARFVAGSVGNSATTGTVVSASRGDVVSAYSTGNKQGTTGKRSGTVAGIVIGLLFGILLILALSLFGIYLYGRMTD